MKFIVGTYLDPLGYGWRFAIKTSCIYAGFGLKLKTHYPQKFFFFERRIDRVGVKYDFQVWRLMFSILKIS